MTDNLNGWKRGRPVRDGRVWLGGWEDRPHALVMHDGRVWVASDMGAFGPWKPCEEPQWWRKPTDGDVPPPPGRLPAGMRWRGHDDGTCTPCFEVPSGIIDIRPEGLSWNERVPVHHDCTGEVVGHTWERHVVSWADIEAARAVFASNEGGDDE